MLDREEKTIKKFKDDNPINNRSLEIINKALEELKKKFTDSRTDQEIFEKCSSLIQKIVTSPNSENRAELQDALREEIRAWHCESKKSGISTLKSIYKLLEKHISPIQRKIESAFPLHKIMSGFQIQYDSSVLKEKFSELKKDIAELLSLTTESEENQELLQSWTQKVFNLEKLILKAKNRNIFYKSAYKFFQILEEIEFRKKEAQSIKTNLLLPTVTPSPTPKTTVQSLTPKTEEKKKHPGKRKTTPSLKPKPKETNTKNSLSASAVEPVARDTSVELLSVLAPPQAVESPSTSTQDQKSAPDKNSSSASEAVEPVAPDVSVKPPSVVSTPSQAAGSPSISTPTTDQKSTPNKNSSSAKKKSSKLTPKPEQKQKETNTQSDPSLSAAKPVTTDAPAKLPSTSTRDQKNQKPKSIIGTTSQILNSLADVKSPKNVQRKLTRADRRLDGLARFLHKALNLKKLDPRSTALTILPKDAKQSNLVVATGGNVAPELVAAALYELPFIAEQHLLTLKVPLEKKEIILFVRQQTKRLKLLIAELRKYAAQQISREYFESEEYQKFEFLIKNVRYDIDLAKFFLLMKFNSSADEPRYAVIRDIFKRKRFVVLPNENLAHPEMVIAEYIARTPGIPRQVYIGSHILTCKKCHILIQGEETPIPSERFTVTRSTYGPKKDKLGLRAIHHILGFNDLPYSTKIFTRGHYDLGYPEGFVPKFSVQGNQPPKLPLGCAARFIKGRLNTLSSPASGARPDRLFLAEHPPLSDSEDEQDSSQNNNQSFSD